jgi:hypothetical protein
LTAFFVCDRITKQALAAAKARGVQFGNAKQAKDKREADRFAMTPCRPDRTSSKRKVATPRGSRWHGGTVARLLDRLHLRWSCEPDWLDGSSWMFFFRAWTFRPGARVRSVLVELIGKGNGVSLNSGQGAGIDVEKDHGDWYKSIGQGTGAAQSSSASSLAVAPRSPAYN